MSDFPYSNSQTNFCSDSPKCNAKEINARLLEKAAAFAQHLKTNQQALMSELSSYQSYLTTQDEFERSIECLSSLEEVLPYLQRRTKNVAVFFPLNLPIYSFTLFAAIPALIADQVYIRPPQAMMPVFSRILPLLNCPPLFPNIHTSFDTREDFLHNHVTHADVTIFTGREKNARHVLAKARKDSLFLFNGFGWNPIVANPDADLNLAVRKTVEAKLFNSGQDCAGPDTILVHRNIANEFIAMLKDQLSCIKVGDYTDPNVKVGKIMEPSCLRGLGAFLLQHRDDIVYGGCIDYLRGIVHPTVLVSFLGKQSNFKEFFSPIFYVSIFDSDEQLSAYFDTPQYAANEMYVSVFGSSPYIDSLARSIVIHENTILGVERGNKAYGGMSLGASFVASQGKAEARPILIPREIFRHLEIRANPIQRLSAKQQTRICEEVKKALTRFFGANLVFGFVFGSVARGNATSKSDIDTMVVLDHSDEEQTALYLGWLEQYHREMNMAVDHVYPAEIVTRRILEETLAHVDEVQIDFEHTEPTIFDTIVWVDVLTGIKRGIQGNEELLLTYSRRFGRYPKLWKDQIMDALRRRVSQPGDAENFGCQQTMKELESIRRMKPDLVIKKFIGLEHL